MGTERGRGLFRPILVVCALGAAACSSDGSLSYAPRVQNPPGGADIERLEVPGPDRVEGPRPLASAAAGRPDLAGGLSGVAGAPVGSVSIVAEAGVPRVSIHAQPDAAPSFELDHPQESGAPLVFLVREQREEWLEVLLPMRPNGSTGWVKRDDVVLSQHDYQIVVDLDDHRLTVYRGEEVVVDELVGVGRRNAPTPGGIYYTKELIQPADEAGQLQPDGPYGPYAYGLSGFAAASSRFTGDDGVIGIHGTNDPAALGRDVSAGCIRVSNEAITRMAAELPLGVPVDVRP